MMIIMILSLLILLTNWQWNARTSFCIHEEKQALDFIQVFHATSLELKNRELQRRWFFLLLQTDCNCSILQIAALVSSEFGVEFRMMEKVDVKGSNVHPVWRYLAGEALWDWSIKRSQKLSALTGALEVTLWGSQLATQDSLSSIRSSVSLGSQVWSIHVPAVVHLCKELLSDLMMYFFWLSCCTLTL